MASSFSWVAPIRPYLIVVSVAVLSFAWYQKLKPGKTELDCCAVDEKPGFIQSKTFLVLLTVFALTMMAFPFYSNLFFGQNDKQVIIMDRSTIDSVQFNISGMTCTSCEDHIEYAVNKLPGIIEVNASYEKSNTTVKYDTTQTTPNQIEEAIHSTGYTIIHSGDKN